MMMFCFSEGFWIKNSLSFHVDCQTWISRFCFAWRDDECFHPQPQQGVNLSCLSDFVGQTSDAATGAASIIVNSAGKCFYHYLTAPCSQQRESCELTCWNGFVCTKQRVNLYKWCALSLLYIHKQTLKVQCNWCQHCLIIAQVKLSHWPTHIQTHYHKYSQTAVTHIFKCIKPCWVSFGHSPEKLSLKFMLLKTVFIYGK